MSSSGIRKFKTMQDRQVEILINQESNFISSLKVTGTEQSLGGIVSLGEATSGGPGASVGNFLETGGGSMSGPIAYFPQDVTIDSDDNINVGFEQGAYSTYVRMTATGATDDLINIIGAVFRGQDLILQCATGKTITLKTTGNIIPPGGADFVLNADDIVKAIFDEVVNKWRIYAGAGSSGGIPQGTLENQHLEWDDTAKEWKAVDNISMFIGTAARSINNAEGVTFISDLAASRGQIGRSDLFGTSQGLTINIQADDNWVVSVDTVEKIKLDDTNDQLIIDEEIQMLTNNIIGGGAGVGMTNVGHFDFVDNLATPGATFSIYSDGTDLLANTGSHVTNLDALVENPLTGNLDFANFDANNVENLRIVRDDGTARLGILGGTLASTQVLFDAVTGVNIRFTEGLADRFEIRNSDNTLQGHVELQMNANKISGVLNPTAPNDVVTRDYYLTNGIWLELDGTTTMTGDLEMGDQSISNANDLRIVRDDSASRMNIIGGVGASAQVLFDAVTNIDIRFTEALADVFEIQNSTNTIRMHRPVNFENDGVIDDINNINFVRDDGTSRLSIISGLTTSTQVLFDAITGIDIRFTEGLADRFEIRNSTNTLQGHVELQMNANKITGVLNPTVPQDVVTLDFFNTTGDSQWLETDGTGAMSGDLDMGDNALFDATDVRIVRDDSTGRLNIIGGTGVTTQVLFDAASNIDIRFTEALADVFELRNSDNTIRMHRVVNFESNSILNASIDAGLIDSGILGTARGGTSNAAYTRGDILYSPTTNNLSRLPIGTVGQVLESDGTDISWEDPTGGATTLNDLTDVTITAPGNTNVLAFNGSVWINQTIPINRLSDVVITSVATGHFLRYNGADFVNTLLVAGDIPNLDTAKITSGTFVDARIPNLDTAKITSGIFGITRGGTGNAANVRGDILYSPTTNTWSRLPIGTVGQVLESDGTDISWQTPSGGGGNQIIQLDTSVTVTDTGTDGLIDFTIDGVNRGSWTAALGLELLSNIDMNLNEIHFNAAARFIDFDVTDNGMAIHNGSGEQVNFLWASALEYDFNETTFDLHNNLIDSVGLSITFQNTSVSGLFWPIGTAPNNARITCSSSQMVIATGSTGDEILFFRGATQDIEINSNEIRFINTDLEMDLTEDIRWSASLNGVPRINVPDANTFNIEANSGGQINLVHGTLYTVESVEQQLRLVGDFTNGMGFEVFRDGAAADFDDIGTVRFSGLDSTSVKTIYAEIFAEMNDITNGSEDGALDFLVQSNGGFGAFMRGAGNDTTSIERIAFRGAAPQAALTWSATGQSVDRSLTGSGTTELRNVLGTLINDLEAMGLLA